MLLYLETWKLAFLTKEHLMISENHLNIPLPLVPSLAYLICVYNWKPWENWEFMYMIAFVKFIPLQSHGCSWELVSDHDIVMYAFSGLSCNSCYDPFVTSINMIIEKPSCSDFYNQLETYEHMIVQ